MKYTFTFTKPRGVGVRDCEGKLHMLIPIPGQEKPNTRAMFISARLDEWLTQLGEVGKWTKFTVSTRGEMDRHWMQKLRLLGMDGEICHYVHTQYQWSGTITICQEAIIELFGNIPATLYLEDQSEPS